MSIIINHLFFVFFISYQLELLNVPSRCRNVSVVGHLHAGKTSLLDLLVAHCHTEEPVKPRTSIKTAYTREPLPRYLDSLKLEQERGISLRAKPISLLLSHSRTDTSYAVNLLDCPGHADFREEVGMGLSLLSESVLLVVDSVEGVQVETEAILKTALNLGKQVILVLSKIERLWLELKLPPMDSYYKLKHTIDKLNTVAGRCIFAPESGNVLFSSASGGFVFSLLSFVQLKYPKVSDSEGFSRRLWGDCYYSEKDRKFTKEASSGLKRTFITFILEPLYKLYTQALSAVDADSLQAFIDENLDGGLRARALFKTNTRPLLKQVINQFFCGKPILGLVDTLCGLESSEAVSNPSGSLLMSICKVYPPSSVKTGKTQESHNTQSSIDQPRILCRLWSGSVRPGQKIFIHGAADSEEILEGQVGKVYIPCTRYELPVNNCTSAPWVLLTGISLDRIIKYGMISDCQDFSRVPPRVFVPNTASHFRVSIEPLLPSELPKMLQALRLLGLLYPSMRTHVEESGEHVIKSPGELYLDCILYDLRSMGQVQIRLSDPSACLAESVSEMSRLKCFADTANGRLRITLLAEPMEKGLCELIESQSGHLPSEQVLIEKFGWDRLSCRSVLAVSSSGGNVLLDDTFGEAEELMEACRGSVIQGFQWAVREGPLCEEPIRAVKFRLLGLTVLDESKTNLSLSSLSAAQVVPATRRACYAAFLTASPRLLEPVQAVSILAPGGECTEVIYNLLARRRGHILADTPVAGTPLYHLSTLLPVLDSPGFEVDLRSMTAGSALPHSVFSHWQPIPGDPLDTSIRPALLEPASAPALARDCLLKMRRRRGIGEDVKLEKYFDPEILSILRSD